MMHNIDKYTIVDSELSIIQGDLIGLQQLTNFAFHDKALDLADDLLEVQQHLLKAQTYLLIARKKYSK